MLAFRPFMLCVVPLASAAPHTLATQLTTLSGVVQDARSGRPVVGAHIREVGTTNAVVTDRFGGFVISLRNDVAATLEVAAAGYDGATLVIEPAGQDSIAIPRGAIRLVESSNGVRGRRAAGRGVFIDRAQFREWNPNTITDVLRHVPGVRIRLLPGHGLGSDPRRFTATMSRGPETCSPVAFLDGAYLGPVAEYDLDDLIAPDDVDVLEIYRSPSEVPPRFEVLGGGCGVLAFWTRVD